MVFRLLKGQTTIEALRSGALRKKDDNLGRFLWLPRHLIPSVDFTSSSTISDASMRRRVLVPHGLLDPEGIIISLEPDVRIYDLGILKNAMAFWDRPLLGLGSSR